ncbi:hypothetical protein SDC9_106804 [bioreactor metagenome]|uniref:Uncharacterized protein n=1 Tax=bioreactor metagenome TaxID=1076179 RepID=A0A645B4I6_9ZZZZ
MEGIVTNLVEVVPDGQIEVRALAELVVLDQVEDKVG